MAQFTVRVELHVGSYEPYYSTLHQAMFDEGFSKFITSDKGNTYHLPRAEYDIELNLSRKDVLKKAENAVSKTGKTAEILVTESRGRTWSGLTQKS